jgi:hypothetical protein
MVARDHRSASTATRRLVLCAEYRVTDALRLFARIENVFDTEYESFGLLGDPGEVFPEFEDPRFFGAGPPFGAWVGVRANF